MAQTTSAMSFSDAYIAQSTDGSTFDDISGEANSVEVSGGNRVTGAAYTADGDTAIITRGKREPYQVLVRAIYTEDASAPYDTAKDAYEAATHGSGAYWIRWSPRGDDSGELRFTTSTGVIKNPVYPAGDASTGDPLLIEILVECASITEATVA